MAKSSIHIRKSINGIVGHNSRENFSYSRVFTDELNECDYNKNVVYKIYRSELKKRSDSYTNRTGQKLQKSTVTKLSAIINLNKNHTLDDLKIIGMKIEKKFDTKILQMAIHRDEGKLISKKDKTELYSGEDFFLNLKDKQFYYDKKFTKKINMEDYEIVKNYHAHIEFMGIDSEGKSIRAKMDRRTLQELQTLTARVLKMERGTKSQSYSKEQMKEILEKVGKKSDYENTTLYAKKFNEVAQDLGYYHKKTKRKDTHEFKKSGSLRESSKRGELAKQSELKSEIAKLRAELKERGATRPEYAKLEQANKELKEQIKAKDLTIKELKSEIDEVWEKLLNFKNSTKKNEKITSHETKMQILKLKVSNAELKSDNQNLTNELEELKTTKEVPKVEKTPKIAPSSNLTDLIANFVTKKTYYKEKKTIFGKKYEKVEVNEIVNFSVFLEKLQKLAKWGSERYFDILVKLELENSSLNTNLKALTTENKALKEQKPKVNNFEKLKKLNEQSEKTMKAIKADDGGYDFSAPVKKEKVDKKENTNTRQQQR